MKNWFWTNNIPNVTLELILDRQYSEYNSLSLSRVRERERLWTRTVGVRLWPPTCFYLATYPMIFANSLFAKTTFAQTILEEDCWPTSLPIFESWYCHMCKYNLKVNVLHDRFLTRSVLANLITQMLVSLVIFNLWQFSLPIMSFGPLFSIPPLLISSGGRISFVFIGLLFRLDPGDSTMDSEEI